MKIAVRRWKSRRLTSLVVQVGRKVVKRVRRGRVPRSVRISMPSGRSVVKLTLTAHTGGRRQTRVQRRAYRVC